MTREKLFCIKTAKTDKQIFSQIKDNWNAVAKPLDGLGRLETMICKIGAAQGRIVPKMSPRAILIMCADNGIVREGVSQSGQEVTLAVARNMGSHRSSVCKMAALVNAEVIAVDIGINSDLEISGVRNLKVTSGTRDFLLEPAMKEEEVLKAIETGIHLVKECKNRGIRILATGEMGIGNTTTSTAVVAGILGLNVREITGRGAGLDQTGIQRKTEVIIKGLEQHGFLTDVSSELTGSATRTITGDITGNRTCVLKERAFEILRCVGGLDIAGLCGVFIGGAMYQVPVVIDGLISAAAALCADCIVPESRHFMLASHVGAEPGMQYILQHLELQEVIRADLALGEGTGAVMLFPLLDMAMEVYRGSSTFDEIGVSQYQRYDQ